MTSESCRFTVDKANGLLEPARKCASPNCDERPDGAEPTMIVVHGISLPPGQFGGPEIEALFTNTLDWDAHPYFGEIRGDRRGPMTTQMQPHPPPAVTLAALLGQVQTQSGGDAFRDAAQIGHGPFA